MLQATWGLLGSERLSSTRRTRALGLGAAVREFNELAVPGLGGVWFGKQVMLATLGLLVAERARESGARATNIEVANAVEALACWLAFKKNKWARDSRLRGRTKLQGKGDGYTFARVRQRNFYVTQPMRMSTVQALPSLGFATSEGTRFNSYRTTDAGRAFIELACKDYRPHKRSVLDLLTRWVAPGQGQVDVYSGQLGAALSPLDPLPIAANKLLVEGVRYDHLGRRDATQRRASALDWVNRVRSTKATQPVWSNRPAEILADHWRDMEAGARFFTVRDTAIQVLDALESVIGRRADRRAFRLESEGLPSNVTDVLALLAVRAKDYLAIGHPQLEAAAFCHECLGSQRDVVRALVGRDGSVLRLAGSEIVPGGAFTGTPDTQDTAQDEATAPPASSLPVPPGVSYRVRNLYLLNLDLNGQLGKWLAEQRFGDGQ